MWTLYKSKRALLISPGRRGGAAKPKQKLGSWVGEEGRGRGQVLWRRERPTGCGEWGWESSGESFPRARLPPRTLAHPVRLGSAAQLRPRALSAAHPRQHGPSWCVDPSARHYLGSAVKQGVLTSSKWNEEQRKIPIMETLEHPRTLLIRRLQLLLKGGPKTVFWTVGREE